MNEERMGPSKHEEAVVWKDVASLTHRRRIFTARSLPVVDAKRRAGGVCRPEKGGGQATLETPGKRPELQCPQRNQLGLQPAWLFKPSDMFTAFIGHTVLQGTSNKQSLRAWTGSRPRPWPSSKGRPTNQLPRSGLALGPQSAAWGKTDWHTGPRPQGGETDRHAGPRRKTGVALAVSHARGRCSAGAVVLGF